LKGISDIFCYIGRNLNINEEAKKQEGKTWLRLPNAPDGNTILRHFGPWYFEAVYRELIM
jgi:hypothetical protein